MNQSGRRGRVGGGPARASDSGGVPGKQTRAGQVQRKLTAQQADARAVGRATAHAAFTDPAPVQARGALDADIDVGAVAAEGVAGRGGALPFRDEIQASFGRHDISSVQAHVGGAAGEAAQTIGAEAYATGNAVAFGGTPTLETAAHEAAHVVQQRAGVQLKGGVGEAGDPYEQHADAVASLVTQGKSAEGLLDQMAGGGSAAASAPVQRKLNMVAGYSEALNWSGEAQALIAAYDMLVELVEGLEELRAQMTGRAFRNQRRHVTDLRAAVTALERQRIPNDRAVREARTAEIEALQLRATNLRATVLGRLGQAVPGEKEDELEAPEAEQEVIDPTIEAEAAPSGTATAIEPSAPSAPGNSTAVEPSAPSAPGNSTAVEPSAPSAPGNATAPGNGTVVEASGPTAPGNGTATTAEPAVEPAAEAAAAEQEDGAVVQAVKAIEFTLYQLEGGKAEKAGRAGSAGAEYSGGVKASGGEGVQGELKAKLKVVLGKSGEQTSDPLDLLALANGSKVQVRAKSEQMVGGKLEAGVEGSMSVNREGVQGSLKGSASAFLGGSIEIAPQVRFVDASGAPLAAFTGIGGVTYGVGGSYEGSIAFEGWALKFSSKGKASAGLGVAWGLSGEVDAAALTAKLYHAIVG